jgi:hypothetical protein
MIGRVYLNRGSDLCSCADAHRHHVENDAIEIQKGIGAQRDVVVIVAMERRADHRAGADGRQALPQQFAALIGGGADTNPNFTVY